MSFAKIGDITVMESSMASVWYGSNCQQNGPSSATGGARAMRGDSSARLRRRRDRDHASHGSSFRGRCQLIRGDLVGRQQKDKSGPASDRRCS